MSATLKQLRDQIILDANVKSSSDFTDLRLNKIINQAQKYVQTQLNGLGYRKFETSNAITAGLAAKGYAAADSPGNTKRVPINGTYFPNMLESPKSILFIEVNDGSTYSVAYEVDPLEFQEQLANTYLAPSVKNAVFMRQSGFVWLAPVGITTAIAYFYDVVADLSSDSTETEIPLEFEEYIIKKAVLEIQADLGVIADKDGQLQSLNRQISNDYEKFFGKISELDSNKKLNRAKLQ